MIEPTLVDAKDVIQSTVYSNTRHGWVPSRPLPRSGFGLRNRIKLAVGVFTGKLDALSWSDETVTVTDKGVNLIKQERMRQICEEGYSPGHDDEHTDGVLATAAAELLVRSIGGDVINLCGDDFDDKWGLVRKHEKDREKQLIIAGALIAAEIDL
jgi:hypothetical protein